MQQLKWFWQNRFANLRKLIRELHCPHDYTDQPHLGWGIMRCSLCENTGYYADAEQWQRVQHNNIKPAAPILPKEEA